MIIFKDWTITAPRGVIARQYDNLSRRLEVVGELPEGYAWDLLVQVGNALDIITLEPMEGGVGVTLTADQLSQSGYYSVQLRGTRGEEVRHTNVESVFIPASLSGSGQWPTVPSEFIQAEQRIREIVAHPPVPGENGFWMLWDPDAGQYVESQLPLPEGGGGGTSDHTQLSNRDAADQHPMSAITGLEKTLEGKQPIGDYLTREADPTVPTWAKEPTKPGYTASEVGADPSGTAESKVSAHNTGTDTHSDIRLLIQGLTDRLNALADSDDTTLDQLSEIVAYIKSNRDLIASITTDKVSVSDIIDNLTTNVSNKPLSAAQGVALKALIDAISVPDKLPNPNALTFTGAVEGSYDGSEPKTINIPSGGGSSGGGTTEKIVLADFTLAEDITNYGSIIVPLAENPFDFHTLLIMISAQQADDSGQFQGVLHSENGMVSTVFHLNTIFSKSKVTEIFIVANLFADNISARASKKVTYMWDTTNTYSFTYGITNEGTKVNQLLIKNSSALAGTTIKVEGIK